MHIFLVKRVYLFHSLPLPSRFILVFWQFFILYISPIKDPIVITFTFIYCIQNDAFLFDITYVLMPPEIYLLRHLEVRLCILVRNKRGAMMWLLAKHISLVLSGLCNSIKKIVQHQNLLHKWGIQYPRLSGTRSLASLGYTIHLPQNYAVDFSY